MKKIALFLILGLSAQIYISAQTTWKVKSYSVKFKIKNAGIGTGGSFEGLESSIKFSPDALGASSISASVAVKTIDTGNEKRDNHLRSDDYFDVEKYPKISMKSVSFVATKDKKDSYIGQFVLTIKGIAKRVSVPFTFTQVGNTASFKGSFKIDRQDFKVGGSSWILSDNVTMNILVDVEK